MANLPSHCVITRSAAGTESMDIMFHANAVHEWRNARTVRSYERVHRILHQSTCEISIATGQSKRRCRAVQEHPWVSLKAGISQRETRLACDGNGNPIAAE